MAGYDRLLQSGSLSNEVAAYSVPSSLGPQSGQHFLELLRALYLALILCVRRCSRLCLLSYPLRLLVLCYEPQLYARQFLLQVLGHSNTLAYESWPSYDEALLVQDTVNLPVQVTPHDCQP